MRSHLRGPRGSRSRRGARPPGARGGTACRLMVGPRASCHAVKLCGCPPAGCGGSCHSLHGQTLYALAGNPQWSRWHSICARWRGAPLASWRATSWPRALAQGGICGCVPSSHLRTILGRFIMHACPRWGGPRRAPSRARMGTPALNVVPLCRPQSGSFPPASPVRFSGKIKPHRAG